MFEGHDTTAAAVVWSLFMLGSHPEVQRRCYEEIQSVCGSSAAGGDVTMEEMGKLVYLDCCVKETLRLFPSVPFITRRLGSDARIGGHSLPEGTQVMLNIYLIHRDPEQWEDPELFNPDR
jgi:cytochrome P450